VADVKNGGDEALRTLTARLDGADLAELRVTGEEMDAASASLSPAAIDAIDVAIANVRCFHEAQRPPDVVVETMPGVRCERVSRPIDAVGLYVPAGTAPLPSAAVMLAVPAIIAGCVTRIVCTPPRPDGRADPAVVVAAARAGITDIFKIGGAQAIAAMAYGTASVDKVDKIFGPGNAWVTCAKSVVSSDPDGAAIDMPAGPSEVMVIADGSASAEFVASDLLSQAEHGVDSQVVLVTTSGRLADAVEEQLAQQLQSLSRAEIARGSLQHARMVIVDDLEMAVEVSNRYAPEHLILQCNDARALLPAIRNAGSVFVGQWTPESVGDYCSGTNHVLPTYGYARSYSGLSLDQFMRGMTVQELTRDGLAGLSGTVVTLAGLEGLDAHASAVTRRLRAES
ncbi:MAG: histidinol dehydrogenase, partial [Gammaproteobacteria bacterium]|nr:histidinol dehydrogenase [Gammaproteobacteria bacterium]